METKTELWMRRAVLRHTEVVALSQRACHLQDILKKLQVEYDVVFAENLRMNKALGAIADLATQDNRIYRWCLCGKAWSVDISTVPPDSRSGATVCNDCLAEHKYWSLELEEKYEVAG